jgi:chromosome partitioning protein
VIILAIANQKGGTGKTTTATALGAIYARQGRRVLIVDLDPQASLTQSLGIDAAGRSMAEVLGGATRGTLALGDIVQPVTDGLDLAPSDIALANNELGLVQQTGWESVLKQALAKVQGYDLAIIDCPPSLGLLTVNGLAAAHFVIVTAVPSATDLRGVRMFLDTLENMQAKINPGLAFLGVLLTQFDGRTVAHNQAFEALLRENVHVLGIIPRSVRVQEAGAALQTIIDYDPRGKPSAAYYEVAERVTKRLRRHE